MNLKPYIKYHKVKNNESLQSVTNETVNISF